MIASSVDEAPPNVEVLFQAVPGLVVVDTADGRCGAEGTPAVYGTGERSSPVRSTGAVVPAAVEHDILSTLISLIRMSCQTRLGGGRRAGKRGFRSR